MKIGILGGGQLARMMIEECYKYGFEFHILSNEKDSPAGQITNFEFIGNWNDEPMIRDFCEKCDVITLENEFINYESLLAIENNGNKLYPSSNVIKLIQDKLVQKQTLKGFDIPVAEFIEINSREEVLDFADKHGYPVVLKSRTMGYDGKGNYQINSGEEIDEAYRLLSGRGKLLCEEFVNFDKEIAVQAVRNPIGDVSVYPVVETVQRNHICHLVIASKGGLDPVSSKVKDIAQTIVNELNYVGVIGIEMFMEGSRILVNELAPRVHNSGHYTIEGSFTSQFENHIRAILNLPLGNTEMNCKNAVMVNIIGEKDSEARVKNLGDVLNSDKTYLHIYGKKETRIGRKMGHITVIRDNANEAIDIAEECRKKIGI
jgi:phosphoribosylaminoimidazole carboxylase PurK protein